MKQIIVDDEIFIQDYDNDNLDNEQELYYGTNPYLADTDGDMLTDDFEIYYSKTNPLLADSDNNGITDGNEDLDGDKLTILQELQYGTNNFKADTDYDGLTDYDEIFVYGTDPLKFDSDGDGISDGDEIIIGLDPLKQVTNTVADNEYCFQQVIEPMGECFSSINNDTNNPYKMSLDISAAGYVEGNLNVGISDYSNVIQSDFVVGLIPQLSYENNLKVDEVKIKFQLDKSYVSQHVGEFGEVPEELSGIQRYNIFKYFEEDSLLLPIETKFDLENNIIYSEVDELGTYCIIDLLGWIDHLGYNETSLTEDTTLDSSIYSMSLNEDFETETSIIEVEETINEVFETDIKIIEVEEQISEDLETETNIIVVNEQINEDLETETNIIEVDEKINEDLETETNVIEVDDENKEDLEAETNIIEIAEQASEYSKEKESIIEKNKYIDELNVDKAPLLSKNRAISNVIKNDYIEFCISGGKFTIGTVNGNPNLSTDSNKRLLYGHPSPGTSYTTLNISGSNIEFSSNNTVFDETNLMSTSTMHYDGLYIKQELKIIDNSATGIADIVQIKYNITNFSERPRTAGLRIMMDTMLGSNDSAPFRVLGENVLTEKEYYGVDIPQVWHVFDSLTNPGVIAQGTLYKTYSGRPDRVQFTNWRNVSNQPWNYSINENISIGDSAVSITWN